MMRRRTSRRQASASRLRIRVAGSAALVGVIMFGGPVLASLGSPAAASSTVARLAEGSHLEVASRSTPLPVTTPAGHRPLGIVPPPPAAARGPLATPKAATPTTTSYACTPSFFVATGPTTKNATGCPKGLSYQGGPVVATGTTTGKNTIYAVYWHPSSTYPTHYQSIIDTYLANVAATSGKPTDAYSGDQQYYETTSTKHIHYQIAYGGQITLTTAFPPNGCTPTGPYTSATGGTTVCLTDTQEITQLKTYLAKHTTAPKGLGNVYMVFFPERVETCFGGGTTCSARATSPQNAVYCAYHSGFTDTTGQTVLYTNMPFPTTTCYTQMQAPNDTLNADTMLSDVSHEENETITDPLGNAWLSTPNGKWEIGDECAYVFGPALGGSPPTGTTAGTQYNQTINGVHYFTQLEFSEENYRLAGTRHGCIGHAQLPTATFAAAPTARAGSPEAFTAAGSTNPVLNPAGTPLSYTWTWGDGTTKTSTVTSSERHTYAVAGTYTVTLKVVDKDGWSKTLAKPVNVGATGSGPSVTTTSLPAATVGAPYSATLTASGGTTPYTWSISSGSLPKGLSLTASSGTISGTPTTAGTSSFTVKVTGAKTSGSGSATLTLTVDPAPAPYTAVSPLRICDTRTGNPSGLTGTAAQCNGHALKANTPLVITVAGKFGVPSGATAVVLNVTAVTAKGPGYLTVYPEGEKAPTASNVNFPAGGVVANLVEVGTGTGGKVSLVSNTTTDVVVDLEGYVEPTTTSGAGLYNPLASPARICDTRPGNPSGLTGTAAQCNGTKDQGTTLVANTPHPVRVDGVGGVPKTGVQAVVLNVTVTDPAAPGYLTAYPSGTPPTASNVNFGANETVPNRVIIPVSATGTIDLVSNVSTNAIVDVSGWFSAPSGTGSAFTPEPSPQRICDTRPGNPSGLTGPSAQCNGATDKGTTLGPNTTRTLNVRGLATVPTTATAVVLNVTAVTPTTATYLTVYPTGTPPTVSDLNPSPGDIEANLVVATVSSKGTVTVYNYAGDVNVVVDVAGWYSSS